jgi:hypothetical protein
VPREQLDKEHIKVGVVSYKYQLISSTGVVALDYE